MLSTDNSQRSQGGGGGEGGSWDGGGDGSVQRLESLRELLVAALHRRPDLPLALCVKSEWCGSARRDAVGYMA